MKQCFANYCLFRY